MHKTAKALIFLACATPAVWLLTRTLTGRLGINPVEDLELTTGIWALRFLVFTLLVTPIRRVTGWNRIIQYRRMLGLFAFFYAMLHFLTYVWLDQFFDLSGILKDVAKRPFITAGFVGFSAMVPLALTSTAGWIRRLGGRRWNRLHKLVYLAALAGVVHYYWLVKADVSRPVRYGVVLALLLAARVWFAYNARHASTSRPAPVPARRVPDAAARQADLG